MGVPTTKIQRVRVLLVWAGVGIGIAAFSAALLGGAAFGYERLYADRMFPGVRIAGVRLDGLTKSEARQTLEKATDAALAKGLRFTYRGTETSLDATTVSTDPDVSRELVQYTFDTALDAAYGLGRSGGWEERLVTQSRLRVVPVNLEPDIAIDRQGLADALNAAFDKELVRMRNASFRVDPANPSTVRIEPEQSGASLRLDDAFSELETRAARLEFPTIPLRDRVEQPTLTRADLEPLQTAAERFLRRPPVTLTYEDAKFQLPNSTFPDWLSVTGTRGALMVAVDPGAFTDEVKRVAGSIEQDAMNGSLIVKNGKIDSFVAGKEGRAIDQQALYREVEANWPASSTFELPVMKTQSTLLGEDPKKLGVTEIIGVGKSNFSGSPVNRRKNIAHGAALVNGSLIAPGEVFSLLKTLGPVDGEHKWLTELVIKGNETTPEFGGGLCQIGTTTFRGALASGLPIVERQNHSYRVRYYEPAGTDATIYDPKPDFRFLNDTGHTILINAYIQGDEAIFEFWGTKDGRTIDQTKSLVTNIVTPPPMKLVETLDLPPGKKKCTEIAHNGADASFTYTVTYPTGEVKKETFRSHYRPWQAVCLVGVVKLSQPVESASSTTSGEAAAGN